MVDGDEGFRMGAKTSGGGEVFGGNEVFGSDEVVDDDETVYDGELLGRGEMPGSNKVLGRHHKFSDGGENHEPRSTRRFYPWRWVLLREPNAAPNHRCFLNSSTGECIQLDLPELLDHELLAVTPEGLLVLLRDRNHVPHAWHGKPGDNHWVLLQYNNDGIARTPLMFAGRFYHVNVNGVMVLQISPNQPPRLEVAAKLNMRVSPISQSMHLVNNGGELMLVHRQIVPLTSRNKSGYRCNIYRVNLDSGTLFPVKSSGSGVGRAMFLGVYCSFTLSPEVFPPGSIRADTIYLSFDFGERRLLKVEAYHLNGRIKRPSSLVQRPHTPIDHLSLSITVDL
ncbi:hypothetical protein ZWY2020_004115 [Hordeum vulgare]|nr:hypothetical protein ZWY2020_004115 [Hordeum vulgare]